MLKSVRYLPRTSFSCVLHNRRVVTSPGRWTSSRSSVTAFPKSAFIDDTATVDKTTTLQPNVVILNEAKVGSNCLIGAGSVIGSHVIIGNNTTIGFNVSLMNCIIGNNVNIKNGACIGQDGFGYLPDNIDQRIKVPQSKKVIIEDGVEIGANTCIDRGSKRDTIIKKGTKLDNLIQIAHNVELGTSTLICAQSGVAGSTVVGDSVTIGGQVGVFQHIQVGSRAKIGARSLVKYSLKGGVHYDGSPAKPLKEIAKSRKQQRSNTDSEGKEEEDENT